MRQSRKGRRKGRGVVCCNGPLSVVEGRVAQVKVVANEVEESKDVLISTEDRTMRQKFVTRW